MSEWLNPDWLAERRRYVIVAVFVLAVVVAPPPDVEGHPALAVPLLLLYEAVIAILKLRRDRG